VANDALAWAGARGRHRSQSAAARTLDRAAAMMKNLTVLPRPLRIFAEPFEFWIGLACALAGALAAVGRSRPQSLVNLHAPWLLYAWGVLLFVGGIATAAARIRIGLRQTDLGYRSARALEVVGLVDLATAIIVYAVAVLAVGVAALVAGLIYAALGGACAMRAWIVSRELKRERRADADE